MSSIIQAGFLQTDPEFGAVDKNLSHTQQLWGDRKADLLVLPELFNTGYQFQSIISAWARSTVTPGIKRPTTRKKWRPRVCMSDSSANGDQIST